MVAAVHKPTVGGADPVSIAAVAYGLKVPILEWVILVGRLRVAAKLTCRLPDFLTARAQGEGGVGSHEAVTSACSTVWRVLADKLGSMADHKVAMATWEQFWRQYPAQWQALLKLALRRAAEDPWRADTARGGLS